MARMVHFKRFGAKVKTVEVGLKKKSTGADEVDVSGNDEM